MLWFLASAAPAFAHAVLEQTTPPAGTVVATSPARVSLHFDEQVAIQPGSVRVFDPASHRVDVGGTRHLDSGGSTIGVDLPHTLPAGTYTVTWRVVSADSHPVDGSFTFSIGHPSAVSGDVAAQDHGSAAVGWLLGASRLFGYLGLVSCFGVASVLLMLWPAGRRHASSRRLVWCGWACLVASSAGALMLEGLYGQGLPLARITDPAVLTATLHTRFGVMAAIRLALVVVIGGFLAGRLRWWRPDEGRKPSPVPLVGVGFLAFAAVLTWPLAGHAGAGMQAPEAVVSDTVHLLAMSWWLGGLLLVVAVLSRAGTNDEMRVVMPRFSRLAYWCVIALAASGVYQSWREVGTVPALTATTFGRLLLVKIGAFVVLVLLGNLARHWVWRHALPGSARTAFASTGQADAPTGTIDVVTRSALRRGLHAEVLIGLAILVVTSVLVNVEQARTAYAAPFVKTTTSSTLDVQVAVSPTKVAASHIHVYAYTPAGVPVPLTSLTGTITLAAKQLGPLPVKFQIAGTGHEIADLTWPAAGRWQLDLALQTGAISTTTLQVTVPIR